MGAAGKCPNQSLFAGVLVFEIPPVEDLDHFVEEEIGPDYTGEDEDERELGRDNSEPEDNGKRPSQPSDLPRTKESTGGGGQRNLDIRARMWPLAQMIMMTTYIVAQVVQEDYQDVMAAVVMDTTTTRDGALLGVCGDQLNKDFKHQCFEEAARMFGRFLPHQVWGVWFIVEWIPADCPPVALIANDMGLGKTHYAPATLLCLKYIVDEAAAGRALLCLGGKSVAKLEVVPQIFGANSEVYRWPCIIIVPANLVHTWERAMKSLIPQTGVQLVNLYLSCHLNHNELNYTSDNPRRSKAIHLISNSSYRVHYKSLDHFDVNGHPLVRIPELGQHDVGLQYTTDEANATDQWIKDAKANKWNAIQTVLHKWRLACLTMDLPDNDVSSEDSKSGEAAVVHPQSWNCNDFRSGPTLRWLSEVFVLQLLGPPEGGTVNSGSHTILYHARVASRDRDCLLKEFASVDRPATLILTPALSGTGLNLVGANHVIIMQGFGNLNEQCQVVARIHPVGQRCSLKARVLYWEGGVDDRAEELHQSRGKANTIRELERAQSSTQAVPDPSGTPGGGSADALSALADDRTRSGVTVHLRILLVVLMTNLATKRETMLNFLVVVLQPPSTFASDDNFFSESDVVEFHPRERVHINLEALGSSDGRPLVRTHLRTENRRSTGPGQQARTQVNFHKKDQRKWEKEDYYQSGDQQPAEQTPSTLPDGISLEMTVDLGGGPPTSWFTVEEIVKLMGSYFFTNVRSLGCKHHTEEYFSTLHWPTVLLVCTALRCSLMDYEDTGHKSIAVAVFSQAVFDYYKKYYQTYQTMSEARKNATIQKIEKSVQKIRSQQETERIETAGYEDDVGDDEEPINAEQQGKELGRQWKGDYEGDGGPKMTGGRERSSSPLGNHMGGRIEAGHYVRKSQERQEKQSPESLTEVVEKTSQYLATTEVSEMFGESQTKDSRSELRR
ncbi:hypothetical protein HOY80DRAFT_1033408 [Tuber brumale]|nr:hypothetical protein HOY80DRAFT_1033408 [Tuber brumale]